MGDKDKGGLRENVSEESEIKDIVGLLTLVSGWKNMGLGGYGCKTDWLPSWVLWSVSTAVQGSS